MAAKNEKNKSKNDSNKAAEDKKKVEQAAKEKVGKAAEKATEAKGKEKVDKTKHKSLEEFTYRNKGNKKEVLVHCRHTLTDGIRRFRPTVVTRGTKKKKLKPIWIPEDLAISLGKKYIFPASPDELKRKNKDEE